MYDIFLNELFGDLNAHPISDNSKVVAQISDVSQIEVELLPDIVKWILENNWEYSFEDRFWLNTETSEKLKSNELLTRWRSG